MTVLVWMFVSSVVIITVNAFKATVGQGDDLSMYTHENITLEGVDRASAKYLTSTGQVNTSTATARDVVKGYFGSVTGVLKDDSRDTVKETFQLHKSDRHARAVSMGFAVDITASMVNDVQFLKATVINTLTAVIGTDNAPGRYVLSTFAGQANLTTVVTTTDGHELIRWLDDITFVPKTSCPTYVMSGIRAAIKACTPYSTIYVATDADAKDESLASTVIEEARGKHISLKFPLTGSCP
ncbi:hemicentin-1-like [Argopecten irradians]|uniref:hemicentin-1-like n=1 Tax=Argopecten irradians TaxID=31199 RepID=UPI0037163BA7